MLKVYLVLLVPPKNYLAPIISLRTNNRVDFPPVYAKVTQIVVFEQFMYGDLVPLFIIQ